MVKALQDNSEDAPLAVLMMLYDWADARTLKPLLVAAGSQRQLYHDVGLRHIALAAIKHLKGPAVRKSLLAALTGEDETLRAGAALALGYLGETQVVDALIELLGDEDESVRQCVVWALMRLGDRRAVKPLIAELSREFSWTRIDAALALGRLGDQAAVVPLVNLLDDPDPALRQAVVAALGMLGDQSSMKALVRVVETARIAKAPKSRKPRLPAVVSTASDYVDLGPRPNAVEMTDAGVDDEGRRVTEAAIAMLALIGDRSAIPALEKRMSRLPTPRRKAGEARPVIMELPALFALDWRPKSIDDCLRLLALSDRPLMLSALAPESTPFLVKQLKSEQETARERAAEVLIRIGDPQTLPALKAALANNGTERMRDLYVHCGHEELRAAAENWDADRRDKDAGR